MPPFTRKAIKETFIQLLNQRPLSQITVKDIVEECGINRNSFYYHFEDLPALVEDIITEEADRIIQTYSSIDSFEECLNVAIQFALENKKAALHIYNSVNRDMYEQYLLKICQHVVSTYINNAFAGASIKESDKTIIIRFYKCEVFGQIIEWMNDGMKDDIYNQFLRLCELRKGMAEEFFRRSTES